MSNAYSEDNAMYHLEALGKTFGLDESGLPDEANNTATLLDAYRLLATWFYSAMCMCHAQHLPYSELERCAYRPCQYLWTVWQEIKAGSPRLLEDRGAEQMKMTGYIAQLRSNIRDFYLSHQHGEEISLAAKQDLLLWANDHQTRVMGGDLQMDKVEQRYLEHEVSPVAGGGKKSAWRAKRTTEQEA